jgi:hypothetical protein
MPKYQRRSHPSHQPKDKIMMKRLCIHYARTLTTIALFAMTTACAATPALDPDYIRVSINGLNYSGDSVVFGVKNPDRHLAESGGDAMDPYRQAGVQCCYELPRIWRPGIRITINAVIYPVDESKPDLPSLPRYEKTFEVEIPPYVDGKPGELWVIRTNEGEMRVISSNVGPRDEKWPAEFKLSPKPSTAYLRKQWNIRQHQVEVFYRIELENAARYKVEPEVVVQEQWDSYKRTRTLDLTKFQGPMDPAFVRLVEETLKKDIAASEEKLRNLMVSKP